MYSIHIHYALPPFDLELFVASVGAVPFIESKSLLGAQQVLPINLNAPVFASATTLVLYLVLVLILHAVACEQSHLSKG
jgi:hypothetical protein